jgi:hypothetical protein
MNVLSSIFSTIASHWAVFTSAFAAGAAVWHVIRDLITTIKGSGSDGK